MITKFDEFEKIYEFDYIENTTNGPGIRGGSIDVGIGYRGSIGGSGGIIGGSDASGDMFKNDSPTTKPGEVRKFKQNVGFIKYKESKKRKNALKKLKKLDDDSYEPEPTGNE